MRYASIVFSFKLDLRVLHHPILADTFGGYPFGQYYRLGLIVNVCITVQQNCIVLHVISIRTPLYKKLVKFDFIQNQTYC